MDQDKNTLKVALEPAAPRVFCPQCHISLGQDSLFCPNCGKQLREKPLSTTVATQSWIYFLGIFLPPFGLWPGIKYLKSNDSKAKRIGIIAIVLTVLSSVVSIWLTFSFVDDYVKVINSMNNL